MISRPLVSVAMITYNHSPYIAQALDSVLAQRRDFPIEIVISDDCSPDGTGEIVNRFQAAHPELIRCVDPPVNVGAINNFNRVWKACTGKYIANLDGDDWWHDSEKLAIQVAFMEAHPECTISGHVQKNISNEQLEHSLWPSPLPELSEGSIMATGCLMGSCTLMYRNGLVGEVPDWAKPLEMGDWPLMLLHAATGKVGFINRCMSTYRVHGGGWWSAKKSELKTKLYLAACKESIGRFPSSWRKGFHRFMAGLHSTLFNLHRDEGKRLKARWHWLGYCYHCVAAGNISWDFIVKAPLRLIYLGVHAHKRFPI